MLPTSSGRRDEAITAHSHVKPHPSARPSSPAVVWMVGTTACRSLHPLLALHARQTHRRLTYARTWACLHYRFLHGSRAQLGPKVAHYGLNHAFKATG
jgi:hypothetical protein